MDDIKSRFAGDLVRAAGDSVVDLQGFELQVNAPSDGVGAGTPEKERIGTLTFEHVCTHTRPEGQKGINIGSQVRENNVEEGQLFEVTAVEDDGVVSMTEVKVCDDEDCPNVKVDYKVMISDWKVVKEKVSEECQPKGCSISALEQYRLRCIIFRSLREEHIALMKPEGRPGIHEEPLRPCGVGRSGQAHLQVRPDRAST